MWRYTYRGLYTGVSCFSGISLACKSSCSVACILLESPAPLSSTYTGHVTITWSSSDAVMMLTRFPISSRHCCIMTWFSKRVSIASPQPFRYASNSTAKITAPIGTLSILVRHTHSSLQHCHRYLKCGCHVVYWGLLCCCISGYAHLWCSNASRRLGASLHHYWIMIVTDLCRLAGDSCRQHYRSSYRLTIFLRNS